MRAILIVICIVIFLIVLFVLYRYIKIRNQHRKLNERLFTAIRPLYEKLASGQTIDAQDVLPFAENLTTRELAFGLLSESGKMDLFPEEYYTLIKGAESNLANWLLFPAELDACPDEMEHIKRVSFDFDGKGNYLHYEVFKYRVHEPHWAAEIGWILGVVGPYFDDSKPYSRPGATFSRISSTVDKISPEEEALWVHENIAMR